MQGSSKRFQVRSASTSSPMLSSRETLTEEISLTRKVRLHARVAQTLEDYYGEHAELHAEELAHHFEEAEAVLGTQKAISYNTIAGILAADRYATEQADRHLSYVEDNSDGVKDETTADAFATLAEVRAVFAYGNNELTAGFLDLARHAFNYYIKHGLNDKARNLAVRITPGTIGDNTAREMVLEAASLDGASEVEALRLKIRGGRLIYLSQPPDFDKGIETLQEAMKPAERLNETSLQCDVLNGLAQAEIPARKSCQCT